MRCKCQYSVNIWRHRRKEGLTDDLSDGLSAVVP